MSASHSVTKFLADLQSPDSALHKHAADKLWSRYCDRLLCEAVRLLAPKIRRRVDEQDIVQNVFRSFFRRQAGDGFDLANRDELLALLVGMTKKKVLKAVDQQSAAKRDVGREVTSGNEGEGPATRVPASGPSAEHLAMAANLLERLMGQLDETMQAIVLKRLEGYTHEEIAAQLGCVVRTVERKIERVRVVLTALETGN